MAQDRGWEVRIGVGMNFKKKKVKIYDSCSGGGGHLKLIPVPAEQYMLFDKWWINEWVNEWANRWMNASLVMSK